MAAGKIKLQKASGGVTSITGVDGASNTNLVLPESGTVASVSGAVTDNAVARYDSTTGKLQNSGVIIDDNGNVGVGVTPSVWHTSYKVMTLQNYGSLYNGSGNYGMLMNGIFDASGSFKYSVSYAASQYEQSNGAHYWKTAPSGTAGNAITWTNAMTLDTSGILTLSPINTSGLQDGLILYDAGTGTGEGTKLKWSSANYSDIASVVGVSGVGLRFQTGGTDRMTLDTNGTLSVYSSLNGGVHTINTNSSQGNGIFNIYSHTTGVNSVHTQAVSAWGANGASSALQVGKNSTTSRSINAGGTINASGADYAEYEYSNGITLVKGQIVGFKEDGTLTDKYNEAVRFAIKSTNPSIVGGDTWGNDDIVGKRPEQPARKLDKTEQVKIEDSEEFETVVIEAGDTDAEWESIEAKYKEDLADFEARLEVERQKVDRIAYAGKVPVNVYNATPGQYIVAIDKDGGIDGLAVNKSDMTFAQYQDAVGRVNKILDDGRAEVAVIIH